MVKIIERNISDEMYEILKTIVDSTAILNHLDSDHQDELCRVLRNYEIQKLNKGLTP